MKLPQVDKSNSINLPINPYTRKADEQSRKFSDYDNRPTPVSQNMRGNNHHYRGSDQARYKSSNFDMPENNMQPPKMSIDHSAPSGLELRNNQRYRIESGNKLS